MKIFWSWQLDTPGKTGRHFVWDVLADAIAVLKEPSDVEEPSEREARQALHLEDDRKGVEGSPDLAPTIFKKIDRAAVFIADVTLVGERSISANSPTEAPPKKLINSNVAIEYGYVLRALTDARVLIIQNVHYGDREELPFDLKHKDLDLYLGGVVTAVDVEAMAGNKPGFVRGNEHNSIGDFFGKTKSTKRNFRTTVAPCRNGSRRGYGLAHQPRSRPRVMRVPTGRAP